ncbi:hypothetical protein S40285_09254 [Stachybotrys chlorohalonatus IBT 40285]|uniref:Rhodopsin domain-containing protein n=1 Tax=Stachybotrys chlorohalonatus (strain IBT 40285) TaxID=1283841 RepID=A0A084QSB8_STAC4|nr:hypothetical protein S40285_09254 [Stachybotrys chlorohalonata IBT 40285]
MQSDQARQNGLIATTITLTVASIVVVTLRVFARTWLIKKPGYDDWLICVALACAIAYMVEILISCNNGAGFPMGTLSLENMVNLMKITLAIQATYYIAVASIKISILLMYLRFAVDQRFRQVVIWTVGLHVVFLFVCFIVVFTQCQPIAKFWDLRQTMDGSCTIDPTVFFYFTSAFNIATDIFILGLPVKTLISINRPTREKIALLCIFLIGTFATITSIIRLHTIHDYTLADDPFRHSILVNLWSVIEVNVGIVCASVPALKALFSPRVIKEVTSTYKNSNGTRRGVAPRYGMFNRALGQENIEGSGRVDIMVDDIEHGSWNMETYAPKGIEVRTELEVSHQRRNVNSEVSSQEDIFYNPDR